MIYTKHGSFDMINILNSDDEVLSGGQTETEIEDANLRNRPVFGQKIGRRHFYFASLYRGLDLRESTITDAGLGVFAWQRFPKNSIITEYVGPRVERSKAMNLRLKNQDSHFKTLGLTYPYIISGLKIGDIPGSNLTINRQILYEKQFGLGSFLNHSDKPNTTFVNFDVPFVNKLPISSFTSGIRVFIKALRDISRHEELFINYGPNSLNKV